MSTSFSRQRTGNVWNDGEKELLYFSMSCVIKEAFIRLFFFMEISKKRRS